MDEKKPDRGDKMIYVPGSTEPYKLSRSKLDLFQECPRCFYLTCRLGVGRPDTPGYALNVAVDTLLKREFDAYRRRRLVPPLLTESGIKSTLSRHPGLKRWRNNSVGIQYLHPATNFLVFGAIDDLWENEGRLLEVVDYKATARKTQVTALDQPYHAHYKRQVEVYQFLLRMNGEQVSDTAYFVYCTARTTEDRFRLRLKFDAAIIPHQGDAAWVEPSLLEAHKVLNSATPPKSAGDCKYCAYRINSHMELKNRL